MTKMADKILKLEDILSNSENVRADTPPEKPNTSKKKENKVVPGVRGVPKSGRFWKEEKQRFKSIVKTSGIKKSNSFKNLKKKREDLKRVKEITRKIVEDRKEKTELKKQRRRENLKRQEENRLKSEVVQVIKNTAKIKRLRKKQLRNIEKRDTLKIN